VNQRQVGWGSGCYNDQRCTTAQDRRLSASDDIAIQVVQRYWVPSRPLAVREANRRELL
jgi:hypothetical protein